MKKRKWSVDEKVAILMESMRGERLIGEICQNNQISQTQFTNGGTSFFEGGKQALNGGIPIGAAGQKTKIERLQQIIGKQTIQIEALKKRDADFTNPTSTGGGIRLKNC
jgi:transposase-like protein